MDLLVDERLKSRNEVNIKSQGTKRSLAGHNLVQG